MWIDCKPAMDTRRWTPYPAPRTPAVTSWPPEPLPSLARTVDDITVIRSTCTGVNNHEQSIRALHNGSVFDGRPVLGSWLTYGLGAESQDLPAYMVLPDPKSLPVIGVGNWSNG